LLGIASALLLKLPSALFEQLIRGNNSGKKQIYIGHLNSRHAKALNAKKVVNILLLIISISVFEAFNIAEKPFAFIEANCLFG
jgi:hypothetical protein